MKKYLILILLLTYSNLSKSNNYIFEGFISSKDTNQIHQIKFITGRILGNNYSNQLPENDNYTILYLNDIDSIFISKKNNVLLTMYSFNPFP